MTATLTILYPATDGASFDRGYYADQHLPLIRKAWEGAGLAEAEAYLGEAGLGGGAPAFAAVTLLHFASAAAIEAALSGAEAGQVLGDVANFTTIAPVVQVSVPV